MRSAFALTLAAVFFGTPARADHEMARVLAAHDARLHALFGSDGDLSKQADGFATRFDPRQDTTHVTLGTTAREPVVLRAGRRNRPLVELRLRDVDAAFTFERGAVRYAHGGGATGWFLQRGDLFEHLVLIESSSSVPLAFELVLGRAVARVRQGAALDLLDAHGDVALRIHAPYAIDAFGVRREIELRVREIRDGRALECELAVPPDLALPALIDPAFEVVLWQKQGMSGPSARADHGFAYSTQHGALLFGGGSGSAVLGDFWAYDGTSWTALGAGPPARSQLAFAFRESSGDAVLFGGYDAAFQTLGDAWSWDGTSWKTFGGSLPPGRTEHAMTDVAALGTLVTGGYGESGFLWDTWLATGSTFAQVSPPTDPGPKRNHTLVSDGNRALSFAGLFGNQPNNQLWQYDGVTWSQLGQSPVPARRDHAAAFDTSRNVMLVQGGADFSGKFADTWEWDATTLTWTERAPLTSPGARTSAAMVYDSMRERAVLFGGTTTTDQADTWEYRVLGGSCATSDDCDGFACVDGACCIVAGCGTCERCSQVSGDCVPITSRSDPDSCAGSQSCDATGACKTKNGSTCSTANDCVSGNCTDGVCCNLACTGTCEACDVPGQLGECAFVTGPARHGTCSDTPTACGMTCLGQGPECGFALLGTACGSSCEGALQTLESCDGKGACMAEPAGTCANSLTCADATSCRTVCEVDDHCQSGRVCREGACVEPAASCLDGRTLIDESGTAVDCAPFACVGNVCVEACATSAQCASGYACDALHACVVPETASADDESGCGCRVTRQEGGGAMFLLALGLGALRTCRTRRSAASRSRATTR